eukprot:6194313-Pleurochrysis_carterae.AAC.1
MSDEHPPLVLADTCPWRCALAFEMVRAQQHLHELARIMLKSQTLIHLPHPVPSRSYIVILDSFARSDTRAPRAAHAAAPRFGRAATRRRLSPRSLASCGF